LYVVETISEGEIFSEKNVRSIRPGFGLHPKYLHQIIGKKSNQIIEKGTRFSLDFIKQ
jgi:pseudaminic acid synthase